MSPFNESQYHDLLKGLLVSEVNLSQIFNTKLIRLESEFHTTKSYELKNPYSGEEIIDFVQYGTSKELNEEADGYPVLRLNEFESSFVTTPSKFCSKIDEGTFQSLRLRKNDVLICRTNGNYKYVGKSAIVAQDYEFAYASYLFKVRPKSNLINASTLVAFLNSKYGRKEIEKYSMASNQVNFSPAKFRQLRIPNFNPILNKRIEELTYRSFELLSLSKECNSKAKELLLATVELENFEQKETDNYQEISLSESFGSTNRLDAEYYHPKPLFLINQLKKKDYFLVKDLFDIGNGYPWKSKYFQEKGKGEPFVRIRNCKPGYIDNENLTTLNPEYANGENVNKAKENDIVIGMDGIKYFYGSLIKKPVYVNQRVCHLTPKENSRIDSELILLIINSVIGQSQLMREMTIAQTVGHITNVSIGNIIIPKLDKAIRDEISGKIKESHFFEKESALLLEIVRKSVEIAIEEGEEKAINFINSNTPSNAS